MLWCSAIGMDGLQQSVPQVWLLTALGVHFPESLGVWMPVSSSAVHNAILLITVSEI